MYVLVLGCDSGSAASAWKGYLVTWTNATANQLSWEIFWKGAQASVSLVPKGQVLVPDGTVTPSPLLIATGGSTPLLCLQGVPDLPGAPQDEAGLMRKFET